eukprot:CAMPEP_0114253114 /NCGR_PEP_ID=MMETSP0058-20121206/16214_1 /TAXON_ID=36894 /ORGANISM="Pyramimonas parkeae, CCMP726" /LENGTH=106 /DNA_ID=CAMNT_0001367127 /DNA_START=442 /DNA_END=762 /DNA_ORIENTATION=+
MPGEPGACRGHTQTDGFPVDDKKIKLHPLHQGEEYSVTGLGETGCQLEAVQASEPQQVASMREMLKYIQRVTCAVGYDQYEYKNRALEPSVDIFMIATAWNIPTDL